MFDEPLTFPDSYHGEHGDSLSLRAIQPEDLPALQQWFAKVSPEARYARFLGHVSELRPAQWRYLTRVDGHDHVALVAWLSGSVVGVGRWIRDPQEPRVAEIAFLVGDEHQRQGIGSRLRDALVAAARVREIDRLRAYVLPGNRGIRRLLLRGSGLEIVFDRGTLLEFALDSVTRCHGSAAI